MGGSNKSGRIYADDWGLKVGTDSGHIQFGPANTGHAHIYTDRPNFYFNKDLLVNGGTVFHTGNISISSGVSANHVVQRDGNGYIYANHINFSTGESENPSINSFITSNGDGWSRKSNLQHVKNSIRGVADGTWGINITGNSATASQLPTLYYGGQQLNPQTYFGQGVGVRVAMTGAAGYWSDTMWINGYSGGDVLQMVALHTQRNGEPRMYLSAQASNASSYGTLHEVITSFNRGSYAAAVNSTNTVSGGVKTRLIGNTLYISNNGSNL